MKLISESNLRQLLCKAEKLDRLEAAGVDNWDWYGEALSKNIDFDEDFFTWEKTNLKSELANYQNLNDWIYEQVKDTVREKITINLNGNTRMA